MTQIADKHALVTGGSRGIGPVIAEALARRGANIALAARSEEGLRTVADSLRAFDVKVITATVDLAQPAEREKLISTVLNAFGSIDILINNAGLETGGAFVNLTWEAIRETIEVNLIAPLFLARLVLPHMLNRKAGHVVNIASITAKCGASYLATYSATKAGLAEWAQAVRLELADTGVHISTILPGLVTEVGMFARSGLTPPRRMGSCTPVQVAQAVAAAIEQDRPEVIVNSAPLRHFSALRELSPSLGDWLVCRLGAARFQKQRFASANATLEV